MAETRLELQKAEKSIVKLKNKIRRADLDYTVQASINSTEPTVVHYAAQMTAPANGLAPVTFIANSLDDLIAKIKEATKQIDYDAIEKAYHEAQIEACNRTILGHQDRIKELEAEKEAVANPTPETAVEDGQTPDNGAAEDTPLDSVEPPKTT